MPNLQMMAVEITEDNWAIAAACLPGSFARMAFEEVEGNYLVIHEINSRSFDEGQPSVTVLENNWWKRDNFFEFFEFVDEETPGEFVPVRFKRYDRRITYPLRAASPLPPIPIRITPSPFTEKELAAKLGVSVGKLREAKTLMRKIEQEERG